MILLDFINFCIMCMIMSIIVKEFPSMWTFIIYTHDNETVSSNFYTSTDEFFWYWN